MSGFKPTEAKFEEHIESHLKSIGFSSTHFSSYDRNLCLIRDEMIGFIQRTQPDKWESLEEIYGVDTENKVLSRVSSEIAKRGVIDVLRGQVIDRGVYLDLCYFQPKSDLNPEHMKRYELNEFTVVRQLHYSEKNENSIDMVLFLNGIPIVTMELKNQLTGQTIINSQKQYQYDRDPKEPLLRFKRCLVHFCVDNDKISMSTRLQGGKTVFLPYNRDLVNPIIEGGYRTQYLWEDILTPESLLDIIENFVHVSNEKDYVFNTKKQKLETKTKDILIFPRYHQRDLIRKLRNQLKTDGVGKNYLIQHTTGSGKSYSIGWLAHTLTSLYRQEGDTKRLFDTIVVVTDRTVLDDQLRNTIRSLERIDGVVSGVEHGSKELKKFLEQGKDIVITTIQKFPFISETISALGNRTFAVIIDEVHSSQSGELSKELKKSLSKTGDEDAFDYEDMLHKEIANRGLQDHISFFGFSGTPKQKTLELFGTKNSEGQFVPFHTYSMHQSIHEGFTLDVLQNYTTYKRYFKIKGTEEGDLEIPTSKGKREIFKYVDEHQITIKQKVTIMLDHWLSKGSKEIQGKAKGMIVTQSRKHCVWYFKEINNQLKERGLTARALVGFSGEVSVDGDKYTESALNRTIGHEGNIPLGLKNPKFSLLIVANKFQTGFDEPLAQTMYVDKKLGGVQCVQTLSRLNRSTSGKTQTFVLDFVNDPEEIRSSFQRFYQTTILDEASDPNNLYDVKREIEDFLIYTNEEVNNFCEIFYDEDRDEGAFHPHLDVAVERFRNLDEEIQEAFRSSVQSYLRMYGYLSQIITFADIELEKTFVFLKYLNKKLPKRDPMIVDILDSIDLDSLRIQKIHDQVGELESEDSVLDPPSFNPGGTQDDDLDLLSEIIKQVNKDYGAGLNDEDKITIETVKDRLINDDELLKFMTAENTEQNMRKFFDDQFDEVMADYVNDKFEFYKKVNENASLKRAIQGVIYDEYKREKQLA